MTIPRAMCADCAYYEPFDDTRGHCHARSPQVGVIWPRHAKGLGNCDVRTFWPTVPTNAWCGEFRPSEKVELTVVRDEGPVVS